MNPKQPPHIGTTGDTQPLGGQTDERSIINPTATDTYNQDGFVAGAPGMSFSGRLGNSFNHSYGQPPSIGAVRQIVVSHPSGAGDYYDYGQPPSINDVGRRDGSQIGPSLTGNPVSGGEGLAGMSLNATGFRIHNPNAYHKDNNDE